jgi:transcriptional regulator with XRE-family HTH domain
MKAEDIALRALITIRTRTGKDQAEVADAMGIKLRTLQSYERKERRISDAVKGKYVLACGATWSEFLDEQRRVVETGGGLTL